MRQACRDQQRAAENERKNKLFGHGSVKYRSIGLQCHRGRRIFQTVKQRTGRHHDHVQWRRDEREEHGNRTYKSERRLRKTDRRQQRTVQPEHIRHRRQDSCDGKRHIRDRHP